MKIYTLQARQALPISLPTAWDFFSSPRRLAEITPPWLNFRVTSHVPEKMYAGMIITYQIRPFGNISVEWLTEITHVQEPFLFVDEQRSGPYQLWHHQHAFREITGGVEITDLVHYALPYGVFGRLLHQLAVATRLRDIFDFRKARLEQIFGRIV
ncbi:MAG: SRPBCC family protein [bacterium]